MSTFSSCQCCKVECSDIARRFSPCLGFICPECHEFLESADTTLRRHGIEGVDPHPVRFSPEPKKP